MTLKKDISDPLPQPYRIYTTEGPAQSFIDNTILPLVPIFNWVYRFCKILIFLPVRHRNAILTASMAEADDGSGQACRFVTGPSHTTRTFKTNQKPSLTHVDARATFWLVENAYWSGLSHRPTFLLFGWIEAEDVRQKKCWLCRSQYKDCWY